MHEAERFPFPVSENAAAPRWAPGSIDTAKDSTPPHRSRKNADPRYAMLTLTKCHDLAAVARRTKVTESLATNHRGKTRNKVSCPGCRERVPQSHGGWFPHPRERRRP